MTNSIRTKQNVAITRNRHITYIRKEPSLRHTNDIDIGLNKHKPKLINLIGPWAFICTTLKPLL